ncbi:MAG: ECF-type sigma factor [Pirellulaceae bacterium]
MAARKIVDQQRHADRLKRGGDQNVKRLDADDDNSAIFQAIGNEPSPELASLMAEACELILAHLDDEMLRGIAVGKMEGYSIPN